MNPSALGVDYAFSPHPDPQAVVNAGYKWFLRYVSPDPNNDANGGKNLTIAERDAIWDAGGAILLIWEWYATRATEGAMAGHVDALNAVAMAKALGYPDDIPLLFADDTDSTPDQVRPYFEAAKAVRPCYGGYGGIHVIDPLMQDGTLPFGMQACAWSGQEVSQYAHIYQRLRPTLTIPNASYDEDIVLKTIPMWTKPAVPIPPTPAPEPFPTPIPIALLGDDMTPGLLKDPDGPAQYIMIDGKILHVPTISELSYYINQCKYQYTSLAPTAARQLVAMADVKGTYLIRDIDPTEAPGVIGLELAKRPEELHL